MRRILLSLLVIGLVSVTGIQLSRAFFSDSETSTNNSFTAGQVNLLIANDSYYNGDSSPLTSWTLEQNTIGKFFDFPDLKPSDWGEDTITIKVDDNDAWACMDVTLNSNDDNDCSEPELIDDPSCVADNGDQFDGEVGGLVEFIFWVDDGDNVLEEDESTTNIIQGVDSASNILDDFSVTLADSASNLFTGTNNTPLTALTEYHIGKAWCFGNMTLDPVPTGEGVDPTVAQGFTCDGSQIDNASQTDSLTADIMFRAEQARNNPSFLCNPEPTVTPSPTPIACVQMFASSSSNANQGTQKGGAAVLANRSIPSAMFGSPQTAGLPSDASFPAGSFYSLGFTNGNIVVGFPSAFYPNPSGPDLQIFEVTGGIYPDEKVRVEVGPTASGPWTLVAEDAVRDEEIELPGSVASAQYVRLTDVSNISLFANDADGYDVDAVKAFCGTASQ